MKGATRWAVLGILALFATTNIGCGMIVHLLKTSKNNLSENLKIETDQNFCCLVDSQSAVLPEKTPEEIFKSTTIVHLEMIVNLSREAWTASGCVIQYAGKPYILTAGHVNTTEEKFRAIYAKFSNGNDHPEEVEIVLCDRVMDFALLRFKNPEFVFRGNYANLGTSADLEVGQTVYALGSPLGLKFSMTRGIIEKLDFGMDYEGISQPQVVLHSATINPGNSGGPLMNSKGQVIGINVMGINGGASNFRASVVTTIPGAIPIDDVKIVLRRITEGGMVQHSFMGLLILNTRELNPLDYEQREVPTPDQDGLIVFILAKNSPAEKAGLKPGDLILECDGKKYERNVDIAKHVLLEKQPGSEIEFKVLRAYQSALLIKTTERNQIIYRMKFTRLDKPLTLTIKVRPEVR